MTSEAVGVDAEVAVDTGPQYPFNALMSKLPSEIRIAH